MLPEFGLFFLIVALLASLLQGATLLPAARPLTRSLAAAAWVQSLCVCLSFAILVGARLDSDFTVLNVLMHSNLSLPTLYKITGSWGNHEGSMLLWAMVLAGYGAAVALRAKDTLAQRAVAVQALICAGVLGFIIFTSNPFARVFPPAPDGEALNPLLQDVALAMHPPLLYLGYVGFSIVFSFAVAAMLEGKMAQGWAARVQPWAMLAWAFLTLGIGLGSWWAYRVLGWGGFWFWDPVENASLLPWLAGTALLHANTVLKKRGLLTGWVLLLAILTFGLSLLGTFLVRSGAITSVHSFANDPERGVFILLFMALVLGSALALYALRAGRMDTAQAERMLPLSREGMIVINNLFVLTACGTVLLGTLYPMLSEWLDGSRISVGPSFFNRTFLPLMAVPLLLAGLTPFMPWQKADAGKALKQARPALLAAAAAVLLVVAAVRQEMALGALGLGISAWLGVCSVQWIRARGGAGHAWPVFLGHVGAAVLLAGLTGTTLWKQEVEMPMGVGERVEIGGYTVTLAERNVLDTEEYGGLAARFTLEGRGALELAPEYRQYRIRQMATSIADIHTGLWYDLYAVIGETTPDGEKTAVRLYFRPLMTLFWAGFALMAAGGFMAAARRVMR